MENRYERSAAGHYHLRSDIAMVWRPAFEARKAELAEALRPAPVSHVTQAMAGMFIRFPGSMSQDAEARMAAYVADMAQFPLWAVLEAIRTAAKGRFAPSAYELTAAASNATRTYRTELSRITKLLDAPVCARPTVDKIGAL